MDDAEYGRRRRWTTEEKQAIVALSLDPECSVAEVASCFDLLPAQIYGWRRELREAAEAEAREHHAPTFLPVVMETEALPPARCAPEREVGRLLPDDLIQLAMDVRGVPVAVAHGASPMLVLSVIAALREPR